MPICKTCNVKLTNKNWSKSQQKKNVYTCKFCAVKKTQKWLEKHPDRKHKNSAEYMRDYMKAYRKDHPKRIREISSVEKARRHRELPTDTVLNEYFEGANLHHMTPSVAVYIPKTLHRSVFHNLKTGQGMDEINAKALDWLKSKCL